MKRKTIFLALLIFFTLTSFSYAEVQEFTKFTMDIPENWSAREEEQTVSIVRNENTASIKITVAPMEDQTLEEVAERFCNLLEGYDLSKDKDGNYRFIFNNGNGATLLASTGAEYIFFAMDGLDEARGEIATILNSLKDK